MKFVMKMTIFCLLYFLVVSPVFADTFTVDRDGFGDYLVIQDAVDAAASGDTILIGPGRYNEGQIVETEGWEEFVRVLVHQEELTLIGSGPEETVLGPTYPYVEGHGHHRGIVAGPYFGCESVRVENIGFENMFYGFVGSNAPNTVVIRNCRFESNWNSLLCWNGGILEVTDCVFNLIVESGRLLLAMDQSQVNLFGNSFILAESNFVWQTAVHIENCINVEVSGCNFHEGGRGLKLIGGLDGVFQQVRGCSFIGQSMKGLVAQDSNVNLEDCFFDQQRIGIFLFGSDTNLRMSDSAIMGVSRLALDIFTLESLEVTNCILAHGPEYTIQQTFSCDKENSDDLPVLNLTNNDWGTTDEATIASWIYLCDYEADFIPFVGQSVPTEKTNFGFLKSMYRAGEE